MTLPKKQVLIIEFLRLKPGGSLNEIAEHLSVTRNAVTEHMQNLQRLNFIRFEDISGTVGRPKRIFFATMDSNAAFEKQYSWLAILLLKKIGKSSKKNALSSMMEEMASDVADSLMPTLDRLDPLNRLKKVVEVMNDLGYRAHLKSSRKDAVIEATNCVYHSVAMEHPEVCRFDIKFLEKTTSMAVNQESCIIKGGSCCKFVLT